MDPNMLVGSPDEQHPDGSDFILPPPTIVKTYWWKGKNRLANWGDYLTPLLLARFGHIDARWTERGSADIIAVGSILGHIMGPWYTGTIIGTGKLFESATVPPHANILALRGPLTAKGVPGDYVLGDLGLLADELVRIETKKYDLCIVPHWSDDQLATDPRFTRYPHIVVNSSADPLTIIRIMAESAKVVSSSLHGLILADALNIPRRFEMTAKDNAYSGNAFKIKDHNAAVGVPFVVGKMQEADANRVIDRKTDLRDVLRAFGRVARAGKLLGYD